MSLALKARFAINSINPLNLLTPLNLVKLFDTIKLKNFKLNLKIKNLPYQPFDIG